MPCPYFFPDRSLGPDGRLPLGDAHDGTCRAGATAFEPNESRQRELCRLGYARGRCELFDRSPHEADAVRFSKRGDELIWLLERDHSPVSHGIVDGSCDDLLSAQARAFTESSLR